MVKENGKKADTEEEQNSDPLAMERILPTPQIRNRGRAPNIDGIRTPADDSASVKRLEKGQKEADKLGIQGQIAIPRLNIQHETLRVIGTSALLVHAWSEKVMKQIADAQGSARSNAKGRKKDPRDPEQEFKDAQYRDSHGNHCVRALALKASMVESVRFIPGNQQGREFPMSLAKGIMQVLGDLLPITANEPIMRRDMARLSSGVSSPVYRPEYFPWGIEFTLMYNADLISLDGILSLFTLAGFHSGLCEWRPERGGNFGMFHIAAKGEWEHLQEKLKQQKKASKN